MGGSFCFFFQKEGFCSFLKKRTQKLLSICHALSRRVVLAVRPALAN